MAVKKKAAAKATAPAAPPAKKSPKAKGEAPKPKEAAKPTLTAILAAAGRGYARSMKGLAQFCAMYVEAVELYGTEGKRAFRDKWSLYTDGDFETFEDIGRGNMLPQFAFCSNNMKRGIMRLEHSLDKQMVLAGFVQGGKVETVNSQGKIVLKSLAELSKLEEDSILFALKEGGSPDEIRKFAFEYRKAFALHESRKPAVEIVGDFLVVNRKTKFSKRELQNWIARMP